MYTLQKIVLYFSLFLVSISWAAEKNWIRLDVEKPVNSTTVALSSNGLKIAIADKSPGYIYTSSDAGITWTEQKGSGQRNWSAVAFSWDGTLIVAANQNGFIYTSSDAGITWTEQKGSGQRNWSALVSNENGTRLYAAEMNGYIYSSSDKGITWTEQTTSGQRTWRGIAVSSNGAKIVAAAQNDYIYTSTNYGDAWIARTGSGKRSWYSVASSADGNKLVAVDFSGYIYTSNNSGSAWSTRTAPQRRNWTSVASSLDGNKLIAAADGGRVYISTSSGSAWTELELSMTRRWSSLASSGDGSMLVGTVVGGGTYALTAPLITNITSSKPDGTYRIGDSIPLDITFSEPVTSTGVTVTLETGKTDRTCSFSIVNSTTGICNYKVQAGDTVSLLTVNAIKGTIRDAAARALTNYIPLKNLADNKKIIVDGSPASLNPSVPLICDNVGFYRICPIVRPASNILEYQEALLCEGIISESQADRNTKRITRADVLSIAVNMLRVPTTEINEYSGSFEDIAEPMKPILQVALDRGLLTSTRLFEPNKPVTRVEAYTLLMKSVCLVPTPTAGQNWTQAVHSTAYKAGITNKTLSRFKPSSTVTKKEVFIIAAQLADWADRTGGCQPQSCSNK